MSLLSTLLQVPGGAPAVSPILLLTGVLLVAGIWRLLQIGKRDPRMPKGPPTVPILGNFHQIPSTGLFARFGEWAKEYGPVFSLKFGPTNIIVLCDRKAVHELLDKRGAIYSDRPPSYVGRLLTQGDHIALEQMDPVWREKRKVISHNFSPKNLDEKHFLVQEAEGLILLNDLLRDTEGFYNHVRRYTASVASALAFGHRGPTFESFWGHAVYDVMDRWTEAMEAGANPPVDEYPILRLIPKRFAYWKRRAVAAGTVFDTTWGKARQIVDERRARGDKRDCIIDRLLDEYNQKGWPMSQHAFNNLVGEVVEGAADTTAAQILTLILAFAMHPHVQEAARREIDAICPPDKPPKWSDFQQLPYINMIVKEGMRWRPVAVTALPHRVRQDDWYEGMLIPKDSTVFIATWAIHHNEQIYKDHDVFDPDRYKDHPKLANDYAGSPDWSNRDKYNPSPLCLKTSSPVSLHHYGYGAGRRLCPGVHFAERNMWRIAAKLLWAYEFAEPIDPRTGKTIPLDPNSYNDGILHAPLPYKVRITPRSKQHEETIKKGLQEALDFLSKWN
ncbi:cytochrome P450 [Aspergillus fischeri NRRL 181]|uniref:Cytochrome P450 oxidoreductase, putative n=1 Tax=Neosartorya fischeri (strain ATCC 1020 / DSM 3700 / CBS 544.65 / FGSC A1164 / JCM 1740 / NRRL 181 / WB 181) TaxID=331117 RepID=A1DKS6_NEOFI|nr:Cytochrome P450 oxidoreductase, putative [Aspergillus fischeri NRRL 181]EAW15397.1 Cytochrome P450 oxidoreductase, putative [Aspergillus fischeri NRRL 181]